ncbi:MAG: mechanosensitive ion channel family protein [Candidatus Marinimicrobia bacterium]|nr:mechanosensitive ion channel family protein [Candidatus Neomarinimicrobiota bacterium]
MKMLSEYLKISPEVIEKLIVSLTVLVILTIIRFLGNYAVRKRIQDDMKAYHWRRAVLYIYTVLIIIFIGSIWVKGLRSLTTILGLASAGIAIAMHDTIANLAGWAFIVSRKPFKAGDRIEVQNIIGDVIDIRILQFSIVECGNWVDADQSTGRIIHIPNSKALREPLANYQIGFEYIWNEIPILITFESNWRKAKQILEEIANKNVMHLSEGAQQQIRKAAQKYFIQYNKLTPIVYTAVKESGVMLTIRFLVNPRQRRSSEHQIWEAMLDAFSREKNIELAYPTRRYYVRGRLRDPEDRDLRS